MGEGGCRRRGYWPQRGAGNSQNSWKNLCVWRRNGRGEEGNGGNECESRLRGQGMQWTWSMQKGNLHVRRRLFRRGMRNQNKVQAQLLGERSLHE